MLFYIIFAPMTEIRPYLQKPIWTRRASSDLYMKPEVISPLDTQEMTFDTARVYRMTQQEFLDELYPSSHKINNCKFRSMRVKTKYNESNQKHEFDGYEDVERVSIGIQEADRRHKVTHTFGRPMWFGAEGKDEKNSELVKNFNMYWNMAGMTDALSVWGKSLFGTADAAIYLYKNGTGDIQYKIFSYENGDVFNMTKDENGNDIFVRMIKVNNIQTVEIYGDKYVDVWVQNTNSENLAATFNKVINKLKGKILSSSTDGFDLISHTAHGLSQCPVMYWRLPDVIWGNGQDVLERIERILSDLGENNKYYAYQILFIAGAVMNLPPVAKMGKTIASKSTDGKAEILDPADASNTFTLDLDTNFELLWETLGMVVLDPKDLKGGDYSGAFIKNLYWREVQWSTNMIAELRPAFTKLISIFKELISIIEKDDRYNRMKMTFQLTPFVPKNELEEVTMITQSVAAGITSVETGSGELDFNNPMEFERIQEEANAKAKLDTSQPDASAQTDPLLKVDNKLKQ